MSGLRLSDLNKETTYLLTYLLKVFCCISADSKTLSRQIIDVLFSKHSSASEGFAPRPS